MAQAKLNDYFTSKKRTDSAQAAKRRKIEIPFSDTEYIRSNRARSKSDDGKKSPATNPLIPSDSESELERDGVSSPTDLSFSLSMGKHVAEIHSKETVSGTRSDRHSNGKLSKLPFSSGSRGKTKVSSLGKSETGQTKPTNLQTKSSSTLPSHICSKVDSDLQSSQNIDTDNTSKDDISKEQRTVIVEEVTSFWDTHGSGEQSTPRKRVVDTVSVEISTEEPHSRRRKVAIRKQSPSKLQDLVAVSDSAKKKLVLVPSDDEAGLSKPEDSIVDEADNEVRIVMAGKSHLLALVAEIIIPLDNAVSPLPATPERQEEVSSSPEPVVPITPKLQNLSQKLKALSKMNGQALKNRLKQSGKIYDIKEKLGELNRAIREDKAQAVDVEASVVEGVATEQMLPAYQRFDNLTEEGPPTLSLPFTYKILEGAFQAMDTVVSMMHNRSEMCTFSKLRAAVQNMTKKNFEERTVGQIKAVVPEAYIFRQENNISTFGKKTSGYQLTVEANLKDDNRNSDGAQTSEGKPTFTASALLKRKHRFRNNLISYLKQLHKSFLASLKCPISVPDNKLTRWHPRFQLDKVPEVVPASLPQAPDVKLYHSAKDVLEKQRGRLNPRVEEALSRVVADNEDVSSSNSQNSSRSSLLPSPSSTPSSTPSSSVQSTASLKGIPPALLAKIRAKEAQKMEEALTRSPSEDNKMKMMTRLPEIIRILRTYFVTEKKPALPLETVYKKLQDSFCTGISQRDVELHIDMLAELAPELVSMVEIKRGKFLKLDKNVDVAAVSGRILNLVKSRK